MKDYTEIEEDEDDTTVEDPAQAAPSYEQEMPRNPDEDLDAAAEDDPDEAAAAAAEDDPEEAAEAEDGRADANQASADQAPAGGDFDEDASADDTDDARAKDASHDDDQAIVASWPARIAEELRAARHLSASEEPRALVVTRGRAARVPVNALKEAGIYTITPTIGDRRHDAAPKLAHETAQLGTCRNAELFENAYAILECAEECDAQAIFLCGDSSILADDARFLACANHDEIRVFTAVGIDSPATLGWEECEPPADGEDLYESTSWRTCHACGLTFDESDFDERGLSCPSCGTLTRMTSTERIESLLDGGSFEEWDTDLEDVDPLEFPGYVEKLEAQREKTDLSEAVRTGVGSICGMRCAFGFMDSSFFMGSMGHVVGEKVCRLFDRAVEFELPVVIFCASGGARMQEGLVSLMQMAKTACARERHDKAGLLYVSVLTDPTTGGVTASFATLGDIILAEPSALIGFAGKRVIQDTIKQKLPEGFQTAEFALEHGLIDAIVKRADMRDVLAGILSLHAPDEGETSDSEDEPTWSEPEKPITVQEEEEPKKERPPSLAERIPGLRNLVRPSRSTDPERELDRHARRERRALKRAGLGEKPEPGSAWESVQIARNVHRPTSQRYLSSLCEGFIELHGDRAFADDGAIMAGIGWIDDKPVTVIAEEKGSDLSDRIRRNFGCPQPEGYRKAVRLMRQAEKFGRPIICLVDTQGAFCGTGAEERGQGNAIAESLAELAGLQVPVISVLLGEGGSGGALALALADRVAMQEHAVYSVVSPEGCASILWKDRSRAPEAAEAMRMGADEIYSMGLIDEVISEGKAAAHENPDEAVANVCDYIRQTLDEISETPGEELVSARQERFGQY